jgi:hypothetical protein
VLVVVLGPEHSTGRRRRRRRRTRTRTRITTMLRLLRSKGFRPLVI